MSTINETGKDFVVVNGARMEGAPPFESMPDPQSYETWLKEVMADAVEALGSREVIAAFKDHIASVAPRWRTD